MLKLKSILTENHMESQLLQFAKKATYNDVRNDIMSAAEYFAHALENPRMEHLPLVQHGIQQLKQWTDAKKPAPYSVYALVSEAPALLDKMQAKSKNAWMEMRSHWGGIIDAICDEDTDEYVTEFEPNANDTI